MSTEGENKNNSTTTNPDANTQSSTAPAPPPPAVLGVGTGDTAMIDSGSATAGSAPTAPTDGNIEMGADDRAETSSNPESKSNENTTTTSATAPPFVMPQNEKEMERLVLQYLQSKGYQKALDALKNESKVESSVSDMAVSLSKENTLNDSLALISSLTNSSNKPELTRISGAHKGYDDAYVELRDWIYSSLDIFKNELIQVLYPVFVHCYLELISKGHIEEATQFMQHHGGAHRSFHNDEILTLAGIKSRQHINENGFCRLVLENKFNIRISQSTFELLMKFLQDSENSQLLSIINRYVNFKIVAAQPSFTDSLMVDTSFIGDEMGNISMKKENIHWEVKQEYLNDYQDRDFFDIYNEVYNKTSQSLEKTEKALEEPPKEEKAPPTPAQPGQPEKRKYTKRKKMAEEEEKQKQIQQLSTITKLVNPTPPSICFFTLFNCKNRLNCVDISSDSRVIAGGFSDSSIKVWNANVQRPAMTADDTDMNADEEEIAPMNLIGHSGPVYSVSLSSDKNWLLSSSEDATTRLWRFHDNKAYNVVCYKGHNYPIWDVKFSPLNYYFATASHDRTARLWCTERVSPLRILAGHLSDVECVQFHPNCNYIATGSSDKTVRLWDVQTGECVRIFIGHNGPIYSLAFSKDGRFCASAGEDPYIHIWELGSGKRINSFHGHTDTIWSLDFNTEGNLLASGSADCTVRVWNCVENYRADIEAAAPAAAAAAANGAAPITSTVQLPQTPPSKELPVNNYWGVFHTKRTPVLRTRFAQRGILLALGAFDA